jgi:hypothetical protein
MKNDPTLEAVRKVRCDISREQGNDPARLVHHYTELQARFKGRLIQGPESDQEPVCATYPSKSWYRQGGH